MKRKILFVLLVMCISVIFCMSVSAMSGSGTESDPYMIETAEDFVSIHQKLGSHYKLNADISVSSTTGAIIDSTFSGVFDGNGHTITVNITAPTGVNAKTFDALFGMVTGTIKNLTTKGYVCGSNRVSGIVGELSGNGRIENCVSYVDVYGGKNVGGICGVSLSASNKIINCVNYGNLCAKKLDKGVDMGGIIGCIWNTGANNVVVENCYNAGNVLAEEGQTAENCGGICGYFYAGKVVNCFNSGKVTASDLGTAGAIFGKTENSKSHCIDGYISFTSDQLIGLKQGTITIKNDFLLQSAGVAIYLGEGSGIRGEFHFDNDAFVSFCKLSGFDVNNIEYGCVISTAELVGSLNGDLLSEEALASGKVVFAPAMKNGEKQYFYNDAVMGEGYHSYRFALTGFPDSKVSYNKEFVILGYVKLNVNGQEQIHYINTVESVNLASQVEGTDFNAVNILRVAEVTIADGDYANNQELLGVLEHIVSLKAYSKSIKIDGITDYGHASASFTSSISSGDTVVFQISNTSNIEYNDYLSNLAANGYKKISENNINGVVFQTYTYGDTLINIVYIESNNQVTISKETLTNLPASLTKPTYDKKNDSSITQIQLRDDISVKEGMSYVFRLEDGTFFIVDGGWCESDYSEADKLYDILVELADGDDIIIAGWIFTHCHGDHIGTFNLFVDKYHDNVTIKELLYNFPSEDDIQNSNSSYMNDSSPQRYGKFKDVIATYLKDTKIVKLHSGYKFYYANAEIEIYQTLEDLYPSTVANYDFNSSSTIFSVTVNGQKAMFLGDVSDVGASRLNSTFGDAMKADFMQIAHHGINNSSTIKALYKNIDAPYIFYPAPVSWYRSNINADANAYISTSSQTVKQIFVSGFETVTLALPYDGTYANGTKLPSPESFPAVERPSEAVEVPNPYFDLEFENGTVTDAANNAAVIVVGGATTEVTVNHNGQDKVATSYSKADDGKTFYMTIDFNDINSNEEWKEFVKGSFTYEIFLQLDKLPNSTVGLITSCNGGGTTLYLRAQAGGQLNFQIGSTSPNGNRDGSNYSAVVPMNGTAPIAEPGKPLHLVATYNAETKMMALYINGALIAETSYGEGDYRGGANGNGPDYTLGIGYNPQWNGECLSSYTDYDLFDAKIYDEALTKEQVAQEYWNSVDNLFRTEAENE